MSGPCWTWGCPDQEMGWVEGGGVELRAEGDVGGGGVGEGGVGGSGVGEGGVGGVWRCGAKEVVCLEVGDWWLHS